MAASDFIWVGLVPAGNVKDRTESGVLTILSAAIAILPLGELVNKYSDSEVKKSNSSANLKLNTGSLDTFRLTDSIQEENFELSKLNWNKIPFRNEKYRQVFFALKGLYGYPEMTIDEISKHFVISKLTIKKIGTNTIDKIRDLLKIQLVEVEEQEN